VTTDPTLSAAMEKVVTIPRARNAQLSWGAAMCLEHNDKMLSERVLMRGFRPQL
jgi:hypothetical protein